MSTTLISTDRPRFDLHPDDRAEIEHDIGHYADPRAASIDALKTVQRRYGWVPDGAIFAIGEVLGIPATDVEGVATFYNMIFRQPVGRHVIAACDSISCFLTGQEDTLQALKRQLGIEPGQTTPDNRFTLLPICCLGACDHGPVIMIDNDTHGPVHPSDVPKLLERYT